MRRSCTTSAKRRRKGGTLTSRNASPTSAASRSGLSPARLWWHATRPATLAASVAPVLIGVAIAVRDGRLRPAASALALVVGVGMQVGVNYANDYSDFRRG